jgi:hypothetical protein
MKWLERSVLVWGSCWNGCRRNLLILFHFDAFDHFNYYYIAERHLVCWKYLKLYTDSPPIHIKKSDYVQFPTIILYEHNNAANAIILAIFQTARNCDYCLSPKSNIVPFQDNPRKTSCRRSIIFDIAKLENALSAVIVWLWTDLHRYCWLHSGKIDEKQEHTETIGCSF